MTPVRAPAASDLPALCRVASASFAAGFAGILGPAAIAARTPESFLARFTARLSDMRVAGDPVAGFTLTTGGHLDMLFVDPARQGGGVGRALLADAVARGCTTLETFAANMGARRFYERAGFRPAEAYRRPNDGVMTDFVLYRLESREDQP